MVGFCAGESVDSVTGHFSYSVEGDWPFGTISGEDVQLPQPTQVGEDAWAIIVELKDQKKEHPSLYISMRGKEAPTPGSYPLSFAQESTDYTAMIIGKNNSIQVISGSGVLDIVASNGKMLEALFEFQAENESSLLKNAVVKGSFLAVVAP